MSGERWRRIWELFHEAVELPRVECPAFLADRCKDDEELLREVNDLLASHDTSEGFMASPAALIGSEEDAAGPDPVIGSNIGPYRIRGVIGEGGMGVVYDAEQEEPFRRRVALKVIKLGMDTREVVARFDTERQALALMNHPNIAAVYDAGVTEQGRPYFVMEHVAGLPITEYCNRHRLTTRDRLELFISVCEAIQHAHQKGIIHRDLKPSNVLVGVEVDRVIPKVIDFGIARATDRRLSEKAYTEIGQLIGTPEYISPEQAEVSGLDVDTRTDIYSLGVLLYELLVGRLPFESETLRSAGFAEIQRTIVDRDPPSPSARLTSLPRGELEDLARLRRTSDHVLRRELRRELDWITMKAMDKDRTRRYPAASELALDIGRYLAHQPVVAGPPSALYRLGKFVHRHKLGVGAAATFTLFVTGLALVMTVQSARIARALDVADRERETSKQVTTFLINLFKVSDPNEAKGSTITARELLDTGARRLQTELGDQPEIRAALTDIVGQVYYNLGLYTDAKPLLEEALVLRRRAHSGAHPDVAESLIRLAGLLKDTGEYETAEQLYREALAIRGDLLGNEHLDVAAALNDLGVLLRVRGKYQEAEASHREALRVRRKLLGNQHETVAQSLNNLAILISKTGDYDATQKMLFEAREIWRKVLGDDHLDIAAIDNNLASLSWLQADYKTAERLHRNALRIRRKLLGDAHPAVAQSIHNLALVADVLGDHAGAESLFQEALEMRRAVFGNDHSSVALTLNSLGRSLYDRGDLDAAEPLYREGLETYRRTLGPEHSDVAWSMANLARLLHDRGQSSEAEAMFREALALQHRTLPEGSQEMVATLIGLATVLLDRGDADEARPLFEEALDIRRRALPEGHWRTASARSALGECLVALGRYAEAEPFLLSSYDVLRAERGETKRAAREAARRIVELYEAWGQPAKAAPYR